MRVILSLCYLPLLIVITNALVQHAYNYNPTNNAHNSQVLFSSNQNVDYSNKLDPLAQQKQQAPQVQHIHHDIPVHTTGLLPGADFGHPNGPPVREYTVKANYQVGNSPILNQQFGESSQNGNYFPDNTVDHNSPGYYNPRTHYRIVLTLPRPHAVPQPHEPVVEEKTLIYVLREKPDESHLPVEPPQPKFVSSKPEVYFINYKTKKKIPVDGELPSAPEEQVALQPTAETPPEQVSQPRYAAGHSGFSTVAPTVVSTVAPPQQQPEPGPTQYLPPHQAPELNLASQTGHLHQTNTVHSTPSPLQLSTVGSTPLPLHATFQPQFLVQSNPTALPFGGSSNTGPGQAISYSIHKSIEHSFAPVTTSQSRAYLHP